MSLQQAGLQYVGAISDVLSQKNIPWRLGANSAAISARHMSIPIRLRQATQLNTLYKVDEALALASGSPAVILNRNGRIVMVQFELPKEYWQYFDKASLDADAIGVSRISRAGRELVRISLSHQHPHSMFSGMTGSGKTETMKSAMLALMLSYPPDQVKFAIADIKRAKFREFANSAHLAAPIATEPEDIAILIEWAKQQFLHRQARGIIADSQGNMPAGVPRIVLALDECQDEAIVGEYRRFNDANLDALRKIARQGRECGVHLFLGTQRPSLQNLPDLLNNMANRYVGKVRDAAASAHAVGMPAAGAEKLTGAGDFLFVRNGIVRFQAALAHERDFEALPRVEAVARPELLVADSDPAIEIPSMERAGGRPPVEIDYQKLAFYLFARGKVSRNEARDKIDLKRVAHEKHLEAARIILAEITRLARASREGG